MNLEYDDGIWHVGLIKILHAGLFKYVVIWLDTAIVRTIISHQTPCKLDKGISRQKDIIDSFTAHKAWADKNRVSSKKDAQEHQHMAFFRYT